MRENALEQIVRKALKARGAIAHKLTGQAGDPDRLVTWQAKGEAHFFYIELKTSTGSVSKIQKLRHAQLYAPVYICRSVKEAIAALDSEKANHVS